MASTTPAPAVVPARINLNQAFGSVVRLIRRDGASLVTSVQRAATLFLDGDYLAVLHTVMPVLSRTTPVLMNVLDAVGPILRRSGWLAGPAAQGLRAQHAPEPVDRTQTGVNVPYYSGRVIGAGLKLATYLIRFGTAVIHDRALGESDLLLGDWQSKDLSHWLWSEFGSELEWLQNSIGADNLEVIERWLESQQSLSLRR